MSPFMTVAASMIHANDSRDGHGFMNMVLQLRKPSGGALSTVTLFTSDFTDQNEKLDKCGLEAHVGVTARRPWVT